VLILIVKVNKICNCLLNNKIQFFKKEFVICIGIPAIFFNVLVAVIINVHMEHIFINIQIIENISRISWKNQFEMWCKIIYNIIWFT